MKLINSVKLLAVGLSATLLFACGGGGDVVDTSTTVNVVAQAGVFNSGKAVFTGYSGASKDKPYVLKTVTFASDAKGRFSTNVGTYTGVLKVSISGDYIDEATGKAVVVPESAPLKALVPSTSVVNGATVTVTPLTDVAATKAEDADSGKLTDALVTSNNQAISTLFGLADIVKTTPVAPDTTALAAATDPKQKAYTAALLLLSQYVAEYASNNSLKAVSALTEADIANSLPGALLSLTRGITVDTTPTVPTVAITGAATAFTMQQASTNLATNPELQDVATATGSATTVTTAVTGTIDATVKDVKKFTLKTNGTLAEGATINGVQLTLSDVAGSFASDGGVAEAAGVAFGSEVIAAVNNDGSTLVLGVINANGFSTGVFATVFSKAANAAAFTQSAVSIVDAAGNQLALDIVIE